jgi:hypothetical protein
LEPLRITHHRQKQDQAQSVVLQFWVSALWLHYIRNLAFWFRLLVGFPLIVTELAFLPLDEPGLQQEPGGHNQYSGPQSQDSKINNLS